MRLLAGLLAFVVLSACQSQTPAEPPATTPEPTPTEALEVGSDSGTLRYAVAEPPAIVPVEAAGSAAVTVVDSLFDSLTRWGHVGPAAAPHVRSAASVRWSSDEGARTWTFELRPGATFHDGSPVTAADFKFAWDLAVTLDQVGYHLRDVEGYAALRAGAADGLSGVVAVDELTLEVRLVTPNAEFPAVVGHPALGPLPRALYEADPVGFGQQPVGNGPFLASEPWAQGQFLRVTPFEGWRNRVARPSVTEVVFQFSDPETAYLAFQQGRIDFTELPPGALQDAEERYGRSGDGHTGPGVLRGDVPVLYYLGFNVTQPPFDDVEVRRAVTQAVDPTAIAREVLEGNLRVARSILPRALEAAAGVRCTTCRHDPDAARAVFAARGITGLELWFNRGGGHEQVARQLRRQLQAVGVQLTLRPEDFATYLAAVENGEAGLFRFGWVADYPTLDNALYPILHSSAIGGGEGAYNYGRYRSAEVDTLLDRARSTLDRDERRARYVEAADVALNRDHSILPLFTYRHAAVASERLDGLVYDTMGLVDLVSVRIVPETS